MVAQVLVTGGSGVLGIDLVRRLHTDGYRVHSVDVRPCAAPIPGVHYSTVDVRDRPALDAAMAGVDAVVHAASALPSYPAEQIRSIVVDGTDAVLAAARAARVERVVQISSTAVYGLPATVPTPEEHPRQPVDTYGRAKADAEEVCERHRAAGLTIPILRPKTFLGPGRMGLFAMLFEWAEEGRHFPVLGSGDVRTQMLDTDDLVDAVLLSLRAPAGVANGTYNVAAAEFGTLREDFQAVLDAAGHGKRVISIPARPAVAVLGLLARARLSPVYRRLPHKLLADSYVSIDKARTELGFVPTRSNRDAILRTYRWWRTDRAAGAAAGAGRTSGDAWRQGALRLAKVFF